MKFNKFFGLLFAAMAPLAASQAADVTVYGKVDLGLVYSHADAGVGASESTFQMQSGNFLASRFGFKGEEELSDRTKVGFVLENGFEADSGALKTSGTIFDRGSWLFVRNQDWGELAAGKIGILRSSAADYSYFVLGARVSPFGSGWNAAGSPMYMMPFYGVLRDNTLAYVSPSMNGLKIHAQYAMGSNEYENKPSTDRYYGVAATYDHDRFQLVALLDSLNENSKDKDGVNDSWGLTLGGNATFDFAKVYGWAQYFKDANTLMGLPGLTDYKLFNGLDEISGYSVNAAINKTIGSGNFMLMASYMNAEPDDEMTDLQRSQVGDELDRYSLSVGYLHHLSKTLKFYAAATYYKDKVDFKTADGTEFHNPSVVQIMSGLCLSF